MRVATKKAQAARAAVASCGADIARIEAELFDLAQQHQEFRAVMATELPRISRGVSALVGTEQGAADGVLEQSAIDELMAQLEHGIPEALRDSKTALVAFSHLEKLEAATSFRQCALEQLRSEEAKLVRFAAGGNASTPNQ